MAWDDVVGKAFGRGKERYIVLQVVLTEKFFGTGSGVKSLTNFIQYQQHLQVPRDFVLATKFRRPWCLN